MIIISWWIVLFSIALALSLLPSVFGSSLSLSYTSSEETEKEESTYHHHGHHPHYLRGLQEAYYYDYYDNNEPSQRIVNGHDADPNRYPYYVALLRSDYTFTCGGSLIAPDVVLTAAHCDLGLITALVGVYYFDSNGNKNTQGPTYEEIFIMDTYRHPLHDAYNRRYDQMVVKLLRPANTTIFPKVNFNSSIPSDPTTNNNKNNNNNNNNGAADTTSIVVIGMGRTSVRQRELQSSSFYGGGGGGGSSTVRTLQELTVDYVPNDQCIKAKQQDLNYKDEIYEDHICFLAKNAGACFGDSGGPYIQIDSTNNQVSGDIIVGTVSWGVECGSSEFPSVGSRVSVTDFIRTKTCEISDNPPKYLGCPTPAPTRVPSSSPTAVPTKKPTVYIDFSLLAAFASNTTSPTVQPTTGSG